LLYKSQDVPVSHRLRFSVRQAGLAVILLLILAGCGGRQTPTINPNETVTVTRLDGSITLVRPSAGLQTTVGDTELLAVGDHLYTEKDHTATLQFADGSTLQFGSDVHLMFFALRQPDRVPVFRLLSGTINTALSGTTFEVQAYKEVAKNFNMVITDLAAAPRGTAGGYQLGFDGDTLKGTVISGEFDLRSGNQQATLPAGWQAIVVPGQAMSIVSLITPTPAPPSATEAPTATPIPIVSLTPTNTPTLTPTPVDTATPTPTLTPTRTRAPIRRTATGTAAPTVIADTPTATPQPVQPPGPKPTSRPPTNPPPTNPPPTNPPPTNPPPTNPPAPTDTPRPPPPG
jgi:hypothetical protein